MKTTAEKIAVMAAHENGAEIEFRARGSDVWAPTEVPMWNWSEYDYRVAGDTGNDAQIQRLREAAGLPEDHSAELTVSVILNMLERRDGEIRGLKELAKTRDARIKDLEALRTFVPFQKKVSGVGFGGEFVSEGKAQPQEEKPPLGVVPRSIWESQRREALADAIHRYSEAGRSDDQMVGVWARELQDLVGK